MSTGLGPAFGRAWNISVDAQAGQFTVANRANTESLRVTFSVEAYLLMAYASADITIFNMSNSTSSQVMQNSPNLSNLWKFNQPLVLGDAVTISAGYQSGLSGAFNESSSVIYSGRVLQSIWTQENVVDFKLTLRCITGLVEDALNFTSFPMSSGFTDLQKLNAMCSPQNANIPIENIDDGAKAALSQTSYPRGQAVHGRPYEIIRQITKQNNLFSWVGPKGLNIRSFDDLSSVKIPDYAYGPPNLSSYAPNGTKTGIVKPTLIGTPDQTQKGVTFRVLMDSQIKIGDVIQLAPGTIINPVAVQYNTKPPIPNQSGLYAVAGIRHVGDTRGEDWYTEITGVTFDFFPDFLKSRSPQLVNNR